MEYQSFELSRKLLQVHNNTQLQGIYVNPNDVIKFTIKNQGSIEMNHFITAIIAAFIANGSITCVVGTPGSAKTSTILAISRMLTNSPINNPQNVIYCDYELTKEQWMAYPNPQKLIQTGELAVQWADWIVNDNYISVVFDEINRASSRIQQEMLVLMQEGKLQYGIHQQHLKKNLRIFMTMNPLDELMGTTHVEQLGYAFKDRITQYIHIPQATAYSMKRFMECRKDERTIGLNLESIIKPLMNCNELTQASKYASEIPVDEDAERFAKYICRDANICVRSQNFNKCDLGILKPPQLCIGCLYDKNMYCKNIVGGSMRTFKDLILMGRSYAFLLEQPSVTLDILYAITSDVISHRILILPHCLQDLVNTSELNSGNAVYGNIITFIKLHYIDEIKKKVETRTKIELLFTDIIKGHGTRKMLKELFMHAQNDLYVRTEMIPLIIKFDNQAEKIPNSNEKSFFEMIDTQKYVSCVDDEYINIMKNINRELEKVSIDYPKLFELIPGNPFRSLINDQIYAHMYSHQKGQ